MLPKTVQLNTMLKNIENLSAKDINALKKAFGVPLKDTNMNTKIAFCKVMPYYNPSDKETAILFFIATYHAVYTLKGKKGAPIKFQNILRNLYNSKSTSDSYKSKIESVVGLTIDDNGAFIKRFKNFINCYDKFPALDYESLYYDLMYWETYEVNKVDARTRWAQDIFKPAKFTA